jgi:hypothetical protein
MPRFDFALWAAALKHEDERFSWDAHFGGDIDVFDYVHGRISSFMDYQTVLGSEFRPFDPYQSNYVLEVSSSLRTRAGELAGIFHHVSRHLGDRPKEFAIAWNVLGVRFLRQERLGGVTVDVVADIGAITQHSYVDYRWAGNGDVVVHRPLTPRTGVYLRGTTHVMGVNEERARDTQVGARAEGGVRFLGDAGAGELFLGYERRVDADPLDFTAQRWFLVGFRALRR